LARLADLFPRQAPGHHSYAPLRPAEVMVARSAGSAGGLGSGLLRVGPRPVRQLDPLVVHSPRHWGRGIRTGRRCPAPSWRLAAVSRSSAPAPRRAGCYGGKTPASYWAWSVASACPPRRPSRCGSSLTLRMLCRRCRTPYKPKPRMPGWLHHGWPHQSGRFLLVPALVRRPGRRAARDC
jgi:hypothetical protein